MTQEQQHTEVHVKDIVELIEKHKLAIDDQQKKSAESYERQLKNATDSFETRLDEIKRTMTPYEQKAATKAQSNLKEQTKLFLEKANSSGSSHSFELLEKSNINLGTKSVTETSSLLDGTGTRVNPITIDQELKYAPYRVEHIRDIMPTIAVDTDLYQYNYLKTYTDNTSLKAEGSAFVASDATFEARQTKMYKIMAGMVMSREIITDNVSLQNFLANQLVLWYYLKEDTVLARGVSTNTGEPDGFFTKATAFASTRRYASPTLIHVYRNAGLQTAVANFSPSVAFMSRGVEMDIDLMQDANGRFQDAKPLIPYDKFISNFVGDDEFVVGDAMKGARIIDRTGLDLQYSFEDNDNFSKDMVTIRLTKRLAPITYYNNAFVKGTITTALGTYNASTNTAGLKS